MKTLLARLTVLALAAVVALAPGGRHRAAAQEPKTSDAQPPANEKIMVWIEKYTNKDCALETEVTVNGKSLGKFQSGTQKDISELIKRGVNTVSFTTTPQEPAGDANSLTFRIGPVTTNPRTKRTTMAPTLLVVDNSREWKLDAETGKYTHPFGPNPKTPNRKSVTLTYNFHYAGVATDRAEVKEGDYILQAESYLGNNPSTIATVTVNGKSVGSFHAGRRSLVVTDLLKPGENEIRLATEAVANQLLENDIHFELLGPMVYSTTKQQFLGKQLVQFKALEGWTRDKDSGALHVKGKPGTTTHERTIRFNLEAK